MATGAVPPAASAADTCTAAAVAAAHTSAAAAAWDMAACTALDIPAAPCDCVSACRVHHRSPSLPRTPHNCTSSVRLSLGIVGMDGTT